jgi:hypothetical protein
MKPESKFGFIYSKYGKDYKTAGRRKSGESKQ